MNLHINPPPSQWPAILQRPLIDTESLEGAVSEVLRNVKARGDEALRIYTERFDGLRLESLQVREAEIEAASATLPEPLKVAIQTAKGNIERFHSLQAETPDPVETMPGVRCWRKSVPIEKVGLYIPGGTAPLFSTVLMLAVPARLAGCREIVLCTPPRKDGSVHPAILYTAKLVGVTRIFKVGGAQAIAALAYGTEAIPAVYKIFGPGNQYVTAAKQLVSRQGVAIDMPAGPSEVLVCADETAKPAFAAADLLSQAEHGVDSQVVLVTFSVDMAKAVQAEVDKQLQALPRRDIARKALESSCAIVVPDRDTAVEIINAYAPEHLILSVKEAEQMGEQVVNAGSVFLGNYTPESVGDYASGTNHTLPTNGYARMFSGVSLDSFVKKITFQELAKTGLQQLGPAVELMAEAEELMGHKNAVTIRLNE